MKRLFSSLPLLAAVALAGAQGATAPTVKLQFEKPKAATSSVVKATLTITFAEGLHGYQNPPAGEYEIPVQVSVIEKGFTLVKAAYPAGEEFTMLGADKPTKVYEGKITIPLTIKTSAAPGTYNVNVKVDFQQCNTGTCFPPDKVVAKAQLVVAKPTKATGKKG